MPARTISTQLDTTKKGYNEKNPLQPQGAFKPGSMEQKSTGKKKPVAAKLHQKQQELDKDK